MMTDYEIHEDQVLGEGGMGTVCRGRQISLDRPVAIKIIRNDLTDTPTYVERFRQEAALLGQVIDGHVVQVFGAGEHKGRLFYAMEYVEGEDLASRLQRGQDFPLEEILRIAHGVGHALKAAWKFRIIHRDIKPSNILITGDGQVKVADFGLARSLAGVPMHTMTIAGTAKYISPEQGMGEPVDIRSDIYSLGVVLFELATRRAPFDGDSPTAVIYNHIHAQPPNVKDLCPAARDDFAALVAKCLSKNPDHRFQDPDALLDAVNWIRAQIDPQGGPSPLNPPAGRRSLRPVARLGAVTAGLALLIAGLAYASWSHFSNDPADADQHRKAIDLALGLGHYEDALEIARRHFGENSREVERATRAYRAAKVEEWERRAQAESARQNWKETVEAYLVMLEFADGERKDQLTAGLAFYKDLLAGKEAETAGQWERALEVYLGLAPTSQDHKDYVHEATLRVRDRLDRAKESAEIDAARQAEPFVREARLHRSHAEWKRAIDAARKARDLFKGHREPPADLAELIRELEKAEAAPEGFVFVPAGTFPMGADGGPAAESPRHRAETGAYFIASRAVTRGEYAKFLDDEKSKGHKDCLPEEPKEKDHTPDGWTKDLPKDEPVTGVDWFDAVAYARWAGLRLPTEAEWEKAAAYALDEDRSRAYPWGDSVIPDAKDTSFFGVHGMGRGPLEWTQSPYESYSGSRSVIGPGLRALRGGLKSADYAAEPSRTTARHGRAPTDRDRRTGFRCAKDID